MTNGEKYKDKILEKENKNMNILDIKPVICPICKTEMPCKFIQMHELSNAKEYKILYRCNKDTRHSFWGDCYDYELKERLVEK